MILQALYSLYQRLEKDRDYRIPPVGYSQQKIAFAVVLRPDGRLHGLAALPDNVSDRIKVVPGGDKPTGGVTEKSVHEKVCFLRNDLAYLMGVTVEKKDGPLVLADLEHKAFKKFHLALEDQIDDPAFKTLCAFLRAWDPKVGLTHPDWAEFGGVQGAFQILGETEYLHDKSALRAWWDMNRPRAESQRGQCLLTGLDNQPISRLHEPKIKRVDGAQSAGAPLVSFDKDSDAFSSYGRDGAQGLNAPVSEEAAFKYATALNAMTSGPMSHRHRFQLGDATTVFWTETPSKAEDFLAAFFQKGGAEEKKVAQDGAMLDKVGVFLNALRKGREAYGELADDPEHTRFFILGLTGQAKGRIGVRFFHQDSLAGLLDNLRQHYEDIRIVRRYGEDAKHPDPEFPALWQILDETCPRRNGKADRDQIPPILESPLLRAVIVGTPYPAGLFSAVMRRIHMDREVNHIRACVIAGYLRRNQKQEVSMSLDERRADPPYRLGRLFAVLERIQEQAHWHQTGRNLEKGIRDSFFAAACSTPASVFPRLERLSTHHRRQLSGGAKHVFDQMIADIKDGQVDPPAVLTLNEQGAFLLGYYHQWKQLRPKREVEPTSHEENGE